MTHTTSQIKALLDAAIPGPWRTSKYVVYAGASERVCLTQGQPTAELIASAPTIIREQQEEIAALKNRVEELENSERETYKYLKEVEKNILDKKMCPKCIADLGCHRNCILR